MLIHMRIIASKLTRGVKNGMDYHLYVWHDDAGWGRIRAEYNGRMQPARNSVVISPETMLLETRSCFRTMQSISGYSLNCTTMR